MRRNCFVIAVWFIATSLPAAEPTLAEARLRWLKGNYAEAREIYEVLKAKPEHQAAAALGLSRCWESEGEANKALAEIDRALTTEANADLHARRAELLYARGEWDQALAAVAAALKLRDDHFAARWVRAQILRDRGEDDAADTEFRWFVRTYVARNRAKNDVRDPEELVIIGLAGAENARRHNLTDQFRFILNEVFADALKADANFWPAEYQAGQLLLEKYNKGEALAAFNKALAINPRAAPALVGKGQIALQHFEAAEAERFASRALEINPIQVDALLLLADVALACGDDVKATERLNAVRAINPRDEAALGRLAAAARLRGRDWEGDLKAALAFNTKPGRFYYEMARRLDDRRYYDDARSAYAKAIELSPRLTAARTDLGLLVLRMGEEDEAKKLLTDAFRADPFHVRLSNSLKVLRHLDKYETVRTEHFILRFDKKLDPVLGRVMASFLEEEYDRQAKLFNHRPAGPFLAEVFNSHEMFSGRIIAAPDLHTVAATTGKTFAMASPKAQGIKRPFNWGRVVRHELTHIFNLDQTKFQTPHWFTEGLAVSNEGYGRPPEWLRVLADYSARKELLNLATIETGFVRPRSPEEWTLAYCQANFYVEYLKKNYGPEVVTKLLQSFRDGADTGAAIRAACGAELAAVETGYRDFLLDFIKHSGAQPSNPPQTLAQLEAARAKDPDNPQTCARIAEQYLRRKRLRDALELADAALAKDAKNGLALTVKALLRIEAGDDEGALPYLETATAGEHPHPKALRALGRIQHQAGRFEEAVALFERGRKLEPAEPIWLEEIIRSAREAGDVEKTNHAMMELLAGDPDELDKRKELAQTLFDLEKFPLAERYAREAIEIDATDSTAQDLLLWSLGKQGKKAELAKWKLLFGREN